MASAAPWLAASGRTAHLGLTLLLTAASSSVALAQTQPSRSCPLPALHAAVLRALAQRLGPGNALEVQLDAPQANVVRVRLWRGLDSYERDLPAGRAECVELPRTIALLAEAWLGSDLQLPSGDSRPEDPPARAPLASRAANAPPDPDPTGPLRWRITAAGSGFHALGSPQSGLGFAASGELDPLDAWGLALRTAWDGPVGAAGPRSARVEASLTRLELLVRRSFRSTAMASWLDLLAGAGVGLLSARSAGFVENRRRDLLDLTVALAVRWRQPLSDELAGLLTLELDLRSRRDVLNVVALGPTLVVPPARLALGVGLSWGRH